MNKHSDTERPLRIGTRGSPLALVQAEAVKWALGGGEIVTVSTAGDRDRKARLADLGGKGVWTKELERALIEGEIDLAVHSLKDVESERPAGLVVCATLPRADVRERLIGPPSLDDLESGMRLGTSSPRREAQLRRRIPGLVVEPLRGNVDTRLAAIEEGRFDATLLASAGLERLGRTGVGVPVAVADMLPAPGQAAIAIETRADDAQVRARAADISDADTFLAVSAERAFARRLGGTCHSPVAALAVRKEEGFLLRAEILSEDGADLCRGAAEFAASVGDAETVGARLADDLMAEAPASIRSLFSWT
ncbi:hydroxymethylbilane synthase [Pacificimonas flava]|uniref:Hydroxymethylbilane synthase n=2 Tax=Pacificimonas TaxID=1960290 RepID=A0A219B371_9SPHN|nr:MULTISPECIES: hydroxymethylbilane synthase [Pacificimonas]MBZ6377557.1 hydroxymethylbilane synthase [Pacificimonas aurantium]OWV32751.1 hydroxymethylbilane synthase [Pacificimonas flava]